MQTLRDQYFYDSILVTPKKAWPFPLRIMQVDVIFRNTIMMSEALTPSKYKAPV